MKTIEDSLKSLQLAADTVPTLTDTLQKSNAEFEESEFCFVFKNLAP
jgi:hypothetical protein